LDYTGCALVLIHQKEPDLIEPFVSKSDYIGYSVCFWFT